MIPRVLSAAALTAILGTAAGGCRDVEFSGKTVDPASRSRGLAPDGGSGTQETGGGTEGGAPEGGVTAGGAPDGAAPDRPGGCDAEANCGSSVGSHPGGGSAGTDTSAGESAEDGQSESDGDAASAADDPAGEETDAACVDGDRLKARFASPIQICLDSGHLYDFGGKTCSALKAASKFPCTWAGVLAALSVLGLEGPTAKLTRYRDDGGKLVACGEKAGGLVVQVVRKGTASLGPKCKATARTAVLTGCYESENTATAGQSDEDRVGACF